VAEWSAVAVDAPLTAPSVVVPGDPTAPVTVSAVIVTWNSRQVAVDCLASLARHPPAGPWEAIVIDNGSADGTVDAVRRAAPWARVIANRANRGLPAANNQGMLAARGRAFLISNPDVLYRQGTVDALLATLDRRPRAAWVVPRLLYEDGTLQTSAGDLPTLGEALAGRQLDRARRQQAGVESGQWWDGWAHDEERCIGRGHESVYLMRRQAVEEVVLQDEEYRLDWEGFDWTARLRDAGWEVWLSPEAEAVHLGGVSIRQVRARSIVWSHRGMYRYFAARQPPAMRLPLAAVIAARAGVKLAAAAGGAKLYERAYRPPGPPSDPGGQ
jgi:GT2 family glycosyltransferase